MTYSELWHRLTPLYDPHEAQAVVRTLLSDCFDLSLTDIVCGKVNELSAESQRMLEEKMRRLEAGEPVQYVTGVAFFAGRPYHVDPSVLIPRPETAGLCELVKAQTEPNGSPLVLDIGTGSGCIAITLALEITGADVEAWDISAAALATANRNAQELGAKVRFGQHDALNVEALPVPDAARKYDVIVSNPPYICDSERRDMEKNVLEHEPEGALFVPDDDPLRFYKAIARYASVALKRGGHLCFETNSRFAGDTAAMLKEQGFAQADVKKDMFGNNRFVISTF